MKLEDWLAADRILVGVDADTVGEVLAVASSSIAPAVEADEAVVVQALSARIGEGGFAVGDGVAAPHAEVSGVRAAAGALVVTTKPIDVGALDEFPADIFFVVVAQPNAPAAHLRLLADLARLAQSRLLRAALRRATSPTEAWELLQAAALRERSAPAMEAAAAKVTQYLAVIGLAGEKAVDALMVELLAQGFEESAVIEAQTLKDAATAGVPLFAGFREIFGDPTGRRMFLVEIEADRTEWLTAAIRRICEDRRATAATLSLLPLESRWQWRPDPPAEDSSDH